MSESSNPGDGPSASKRRKLSLSLTRKRATCTTSTATERFEILDDAKSEALTKKFVPKNTGKSIQWALSTFLSWRDKRNQCFSEEPEKQVPLDNTGKHRPSRFLQVVHVICCRGSEKRWHRIPA